VFAESGDSKSVSKSLSFSIKALILKLTIFGLDSAVSFFYNLEIDSLKNACIDSRSLSVSILFYLIKINS